MQLTFGPSSTSVGVPISISGDTVYEPGIEQFLANLELVTTDVDVIVRPEQATIQIFDDDGKPVICHSSYSNYGCFQQSRSVLK